jgi:alkylation response protein AidB-like acyl-CoA dehydrogenase
MNFDFSDDQKQLRDEARKFLAEKCPPKAVRTVLDGKEPYDRALWKGLAEMGFLGVAIPEAYGGAGAGHLELCVIAEEMGRALAPVPFSSTVYLAAEAILLAGSEAQKQKWLPAIAAGEAIGTLALFEGKGNPSPQGINLSAAGGSLNGVKKPVPDGAIADFAIVAARTGPGGRESDISLFLVEMKAGGVEAKTLTNLDPSRGQAELTFRNCKAEPLGAANQGWDILIQVLDRAAVLMAFEQVGGADRALEMGRDYALDRIAFGRPIGSFQAIQHLCADMLIAVDGIELLTSEAVWRLGAGLPASVEVSQAKAFAADHAIAVCRSSQQIHGGIGFMLEFDLHLWYRRIVSWCLRLGGAPQHRRRVAAALLDVSRPATTIRLGDRLTLPDGSARH